MWRLWIAFISSVSPPLDTFLAILVGVYNNTAAHHIHTIQHTWTPRELLVELVGRDERIVLTEGKQTRARGHSSWWIPAKSCNRED